MGWDLLLVLVSPPLKSLFISMIEIWLKSTSVNFQWHIFTLFRQMGLVGLGGTTGRGSKTLSKIFFLAPTISLMGVCCFWMSNFLENEINVF